MSDSRTSRDEPRPTVPESDVKARERAKLDIGDSHPEDRDIRPDPSEDERELDVGDPHPADRDVHKKA
jgi:hypothetical protein